MREIEGANPSSPTFFMNLIKLKCTNCKASVYRAGGRINEAKKFGWKTFCSVRCQGDSRSTQKFLRCANKECGNRFFRSEREVRKMNAVYCSRSCAVSVNNSRHPKRKKQIIENTCGNCGKTFLKKGLFCSIKCKFKGQIIKEDEITGAIKDFYYNNGRIPFKKEFNSYNAARNRFGSWNKAVEAAGFTPNPVMFANKHIAKDGHKCDSLAEKIVDDWLNDRDIAHKRSVQYEYNPNFTCDFVVDDYFIEFFGLENEHKRYSEIVKRKRVLAKKYNLNLIELSPRHLLPKNKLDSVLGFLLK